ncbi:MAG: DUF1566 domain-containing protein [Rhodoferax sp.]|nr:DUF1566 domain-containing protein [Rhodoferax sp.]
MHRMRPHPAISATRFVLPWLLALLLLLSAPFAIAKTYVDNADGTVTDPSTGLTWMRCVVGMAWTGSSCSGIANDYYAHYDASVYNALNGTTFAGHSDWRLPNIRELQTIVDRTVANPAVDSAMFPVLATGLSLVSGTFTSDTTSTTRTTDTVPWIVDFYFRTSYPDNSATDQVALPRRVLLVRGGESSGSLLSIARPTSDYVDHGDGTVTHTPTNLTWKRCAEGQTWTGSTCSGEALRHDFDQANALTGTTSFAGMSDWRLPTEDELLSLVDYSSYGTTTNTSIFPVAPSLGFWSSSPTMEGVAWLVRFDEGGKASFSYRGEGNAVRLVRGGPSWGATEPVCTLSASPSAPVVAAGTRVALVASCTPAATRYTWSDNACPGATGSICTLTPAATASYSVQGVNALTAKSAAASVTVTVATPPASTLQANADGTVSDTKTGLVWMRCAVGMRWTGSTCTGTASTYTFDQTRRLTDAVTFAGQSDWRIPTIRELQTIVNGPTLNTAIDTTVFSNTPHTPFWSGTADARLNLDWAWAVDFFNGYTYETYSHSSYSDYFYALRLVRGGESAGSLLDIRRPTSDYVDHGDGTVTHTPTNLTWKRCAQGQTWTGSTCSGTASTYTFNQAYALNGTTAFADASDWRVPTLDELSSLVDFSIAHPGPTINSTIFPAVSNEYFWSSLPGVSPNSWAVNFFSGRTMGRATYEKFAVRLVRGGKSFAAVAPNCVLSAAPVVLAAGASTTLTARCTPEATSYTWTNTNTNSGFGSTTASGTVSPTATTRYSVVGSNAAGSGLAATAEVYVCNTPPLQNYSGLVLSGNVHGDQIAGAMGNDTVDGLAGVDTVIYNCNRSNFSLTRTAAGWTVNSQAEGQDTLSNVERLRFGDETLALDISGNAGQAYRLYQAAFDRKPDNDGLKYWIGHLDAGIGLQEVAARFIDSDEFRRLYGTNPSHADFLTRLYNNVLHSTPDAGGYAWWLDQLNTGAHTRTTVLMGFSESPENQASVLGVILNGIDLLN